MPETSRVALLVRGDRDMRANAVLESSRFSKIADAMADATLEPVFVVFDETFADDVRRELSEVDAVLVWVNPFTEQGDRTVLDGLLREVAAKGVLVSAHPDTILKMGTKEVLYATRNMPWGVDTRIYRSAAAFRGGLPDALPGGARVLKQYRGNGGSGVFKVQLKTPADPVTPGSVLRIRHAQRGSIEETCSLSELVERMSPYFAGDGRIIDQPWQDRMTEGMVRCYFVQNKVAGFGEQLINALYPTEDPAEPVAPGPRLYYPPTREDFQPLKNLLESTWLGEMQRLLDVDDEQLPVIWDADFFRGPKDAGGDDTWVLCEINISAVYPFPDEALVPLARETRRRLENRG